MPVLQHPRIARIGEKSSHRARGSTKHSPPNSMDHVVSPFNCLALCRQIDAHLLTAILIVHHQPLRSDPFDSPASPR